MYAKKAFRGGPKDPPEHPTRSTLAEICEKTWCEELYLVPTEKAGVFLLTDQILHRQLVLLGKAARSPPDSLIRRCVFIDESLSLQVGRFVRRVGRPRADWASQVMQAGAQKFGSQRIFEKLLKAEGAEAERNWIHHLQRLFKR